MKTNTLRIVLFALMICLCGVKAVNANGCTGSQFQLTYSPICGCFQFCGGQGNALLISDCDELNYLIMDWGDGTSYNFPLVNGWPNTTNLPCHHYAPGTYTATLTIDGNCHFDLFSNSENHCVKTQQVIVYADSLNFDANFRADIVCFGQTTTFTDLSHFGSTLTNRTWRWDFGDGTTSTSPSPTHLYTQCGAYDVRLIISTQNVCCPGVAYDTIIKRVYVNCPPNSNSNALGDTDPYIYESTASLSSSPVCGGATNFVLTKSDSVVSWYYVFSNGFTSTQQNPSVTFTIYPNCPPIDNYGTVTVTDTRGCKDTLVNHAVVHCPVFATYYGQSNTLCAGDCNGTATVNVTQGTPPFTIRWNDPAQQTTATATGLCPGAYTVTITDANNCTASLPPISVYAPLPFIGTLDIINIGCYGWATGTAILNMSGGTPPYSYLWDDPSRFTGDSLPGLLPGTYCVTSTDANGCTFDTCGTITQNPQIIAALTKVDSDCGACNGSATVASVSGGTGVFDYAWSNSQTTQTATGLCSGTYFVSVMDRNVPGCSRQFSISLGNIGSQPVTVTHTDASCEGRCDGTASASLCTGCIYEWLDSNGTPIGQNTPNAINLCAGRYVARVTDPVTGCQALVPVTIAVPNPLILSANPTGISCMNNCDGQITATAGGGSGGFTYQWYNSSNTLIGTANPITNLCPGNYSVTVTDQQGCTIGATAVVDDYILTGISSFTPISCNNNCNATILATGFGGTPPYVFSFEDGAGNPVGSGGPLINNLCADVYGITITDSRSCSIALPSVNITQPTAIAARTSSTDALCFGDCNGLVSLTSATGGVPPYTYQWADSLYLPIAGATSTTLNNRCAGIYYIQVADSNNCTGQWTPAVVNEPAPLGDSMEIVQPYCGNGGLGCINLTIFGGTAPYSPVWNTGQTTEDICNIPAGQYTVVITDANSCIWADVADLVTRPPLRVVSITKPTWAESGLPSSVDLKCYGDSNGVAVVTISGGKADYTYRWSDANNTIHTHSALIDTITGLRAGTYNVTITDSSGCTADTTVTLIQPPPVTISHGQVNERCFGDSTGSITLTLSGGVQSPSTPSGYIAKWTYVTDTSRHITTLDTFLTDVIAGVYAVVAYDSNVCSVRDTIIITEPPQLQVVLTVINGTCSGSGNGSIYTAVNGGVAPYTYSWSTGSLADSLTGLSPGPYTVIVTDDSLCTVSATDTVSQPTPLAQTIVVHDVICYGDSSGGIDYFVTGGSPGPNGYTYSWSTGTVTQHLTNVPTGTYSVTAYDAANCTIDTAAFVRDALPVIGQTVADSICNGDSILIDGVWRKTDGLYQETLISHLGCDSVQSIDLTVVDSFFNIIRPAICWYDSFSIGNSVYREHGIYREVLASHGGCDSVIRIELSVHPPIGATARPPVDTFTMGGDDIVPIDIITNPGITITDYLWMPSDGLNCDTCASVIATPSEEMIYTIYVTDANQCRDTTEARVLFDAEISVFIPNAFTPNDDGINDVFYVYGHGIVKVHLKIFNRWGELIFESTDRTVGWDGTYRGKMMNPGVYVYYTDIEFVTGKSPPEYIKYKKGSVTLIR